MALKRIHHVCVAVKDIHKALDDYVNVLGCPRSPIVEVKEQNVLATLIALDAGEIELIEPTDPNGGVAKFLERRGEAFHHICFETDDVNAELKLLEGKGVSLIDKQARKGLAGMVGFLHPRSTRGTLIELCHRIKEEVAAHGH